MLYFHYAFDDFTLSLKGEEVKLFGYKKIKNRRVKSDVNSRHSNIVKAGLDDFVVGILYEIENENEVKFENSDEVEKIYVSITKEDSTIVNAVTFRAKPKFTFGDGRAKTDADTNLSGQMQGADKAIQRDKARTNIRESKILRFNEFKIKQL